MIMEIRVCGTTCVANYPVICLSQTMSSSLRQKLKRSRRSFTSPLSVAKRLNVDEEDGPPASSATNDTTQTLTMQKKVDLNHNENTICEQSTKQTPGTHADSRSHSAHTHTVQLRDSLRREVKEKTETLRRLQMVRMYRKKVKTTTLKHAWHLLFLMARLLKLTWLLNWLVTVWTPLCQA